MELSHSFTVPAAVDVAWATFMDLERVGGCFPGATVTEVTDDGFTGTVKVKLGPIALQYAGSGAFVERDDDAHRAVLQAKGKDKRGNGTAGAKVTIALTPDGGGTRADVTTDLAITGKPAQFGRGVMQEVSDKLLQQFVSCVEGQFVSASPGSPSEGSAASAGDSATTAAPGVVETAVAPNGTPDAPEAGGSTGEAAPSSRSSEGSASPSRPVSSSSEDALDLGATVLPVLARQYAPYAVSALVGLLLGILIGRRRSA